MEDSYTFMQVIARGWGAMFMFLVFIGVILFTLRPGSRNVHRDIANIPFRHDDRPASDSDSDTLVPTRHTKEARQ